MKIILLFMVVVISGSCCLAQTKKTPGIIQPGIPYDTVYLKNKTKLIYSNSDEYRVVRMISPTTDTVIRAISIKTEKIHLGWLKADYDDYFVLYSDMEGFDYMRICSKQTGKTLAAGWMIAFDTINNIICYENDHLNLLNLFDFKTSKFEKYMTPTVPCLHWWYCIRVIEITGAQIVVEVTGKNNIKSKSIYSRKQL